MKTDSEWWDLWNELAGKLRQGACLAILCELEHRADAKRCRKLGDITGVKWHSRRAAEERRVSHVHARRSEAARARRDLAGSRLWAARRVTL